MKAIRWSRSWHLASSLVIEDVVIGLRHDEAKTLCRRHIPQRVPLSVRATVPGNERPCERCAAKRGVAA